MMNGSVDGEIHKQIINRFYYAPAHKEIKRVVGPKMYTTGEEYHKKNTIQDFKFSQNQLICEFIPDEQSIENKPYFVKINFVELEELTAITTYECNCPVNNSKCEHVAAALMEWKDRISILHACEKDYPSTLVLLLACKVDPNVLENEKKTSNKRKRDELDEHQKDLRDRFAIPYSVAEKSQSNSCIEVFNDLYEGRLWNIQRHRFFPIVQQQAIEAFILSMKNIHKSLSMNFILMDRIIQTSVNLYLRDPKIKAPKPLPPVERCHVCSKPYRDDKMICCYKCEKWVHNECDDIDEKQVEMMARNVEYVCDQCRNGGEKFITL